MLASTAQNIVLSLLAKIENGRISLSLAGGQIREFGDPAKGPSVCVHVLRPRFFTRVCLGGDIGFGEAYMHGDFETDDLTGLLRLFILNPGLTRDDAVSTSRFVRVFNRMLHWMRRNSVRNSRGNIMAHYDLGNGFYSRFLDPSMTYSCAVFENEAECLTTGQHRKLDAIADLADVQPGDRLLEIGCGWGSFAARTARGRGASVEGVTLSPSQLEWARRHAEESGVANQVNLRICDYRHLEGRYDRIASIEMLEAVGPQYLPTYFGACGRLLKPGGRMALQVITIPDERYDAYRGSCDWIQKHIFPGGFLPSLGAIQKAVKESSNLVIDRVIPIGDHYARTLAGWRQRFHAHWPEIQSLGFDTLFRRMWDYYLSYCEAGFSTRFIHVLQIGLKA